MFIPAFVESVPLDKPYRGTFSLEPVIARARTIYLPYMQLCLFPLRKRTHYFNQSLIVVNQEHYSYFANK